MVFACLNITHAQPGELDPSFGSGGVVRYHVQGTGVSYNSTTIQSDGKIVAVGYTMLISNEK